MRLAHSSAPRMPRRPLWLALAATILLAPVLLLLIVPRLTAAHPQQSSVSTWPGVWSRVADLPMGSFPNPLILLETGKVLLGNDVSSPGIYDPATNTWSSTKPWGQVANFGQLQFTPLNDGRLLENVADPSHAPIAGIYDPRSDSWTNVQPMPHHRYLFSSITLQDGRVLYVGGQQDTYTATPALQTDVYDPASNSWTVTGSIAAPRTNPIVLLLHPTFRTPIHRFLEISESATNPGTMRLFSSRPNIFLDYRYLGTLCPMAPILRSSRENRFSV